VVTLALFVNGCQGRQQPTANGLTPVRLQLDWYPQPEHGGFYAAQSLGSYKAEGLDVTILPLPQYGSVAQLVSTGKADFGLGSSDQILEWDSNGLPLLAVAATMQHDPQAVMVHKDSSIRTFNDLEGHTVAAQPGAVWLKFVISRFHLHNVRQIPATLSIANFLADPGYVQQIFITSEPFFARQAGANVRTLATIPIECNSPRAALRLSTRTLWPNSSAPASAAGSSTCMTQPRPTRCYLPSTLPSTPHRWPTRRRLFATVGLLTVAIPEAPRPAA
jgi:NitT/TauT family transport system substrate-binding protein